MSDIISQAIALYTSAPNAANKGNFIPPLLKERGLGGEAVFQNSLKFAVTPLKFVTFGLKSVTLHATFKITRQPYEQHLLHRTYHTR